MNTYKTFFRKGITLLTALAVGCSLWITGGTHASAVPVLTDLEDRLAIPIETNSIENWPVGPEISAQSAILIEADTGVVLYAKNPYEELYPASTTKILTCLLATEHCTMDEIVTFSHDAVFDCPRDSSNIAIDVGEELTVEQCLNAILIASANECAFAVAEHITGTDWESFADLMNERAAELGCLNSHFVNPNGLPDEDHYTSAYDLARIGRAFFANELLCRISSTSMLDLPATDKQPDHIVEYSKNQLLPGKKYAYEYLVGSKTGYTNAARNTLVSCAEKDGMKLICVVMVEESPEQFADTVALFNYGFNNFEIRNVSENETRYNMEEAGIFSTGSDVFGSSQSILSLDKNAKIVMPRTTSFENLTADITYDFDNTRQAALITYSYMGQYLGRCGILFVADASATYDFGNDENGTMLNNPAPGREEKPDSKDDKPEQKVIFINVLKVIGWIVAIAGGIILFLFLFALFGNYHFEKRERKDHKSWRKDKRRKRRYRLTKPKVRKPASDQTSGHTFRPSRTHGSRSRDDSRNSRQDSGRSGRDRKVIHSSRPTVPLREYLESIRGNSGEEMIIDREHTKRPSQGKSSRTSVGDGTFSARSRDTRLKSRDLIIDRDRKPRRRRRKKHVTLNFRKWD